MTTRLEKLLLLLLFVTAFIVRMCYHSEELAQPPQHPDGYYYHRLAENVLRGRGYAMIWPTGHQYRLFRPPGYPMFLAALYSVFGFNFLAVRLIEIAISSGTVLLLFFITTRIFGKRSAWPAAILAVFYWGSIFWAASYLSENLFVFLFLLSIYFLIVDAGRREPATVLLGGFCLAMAYLVRPNIIGVLPFFILWLILFGRPPRRMRIAAPLIFILAFLLGVAPWVAYARHIMHGRLRDSLETTMGAISLWTAHNPELGDDLDNRTFEKLNLLRYRYYSLSEIEWAALLKKQASQFFRADPARCLKMALLRFKKHWLAAGVLDGEGTIYPDTGKNQYGILYFYKRFWKPETYIRDNVMVSMDLKKRLEVHGIWIPLLTFEGVFNICVLGFCAGLIAAKGKLFSLLADVWNRSSLIVLLAIGYSIFSMFGFAHYRLRYPIEWFALIFAGWGLANFPDLVPSIRVRAVEGIPYPPPHCGYLLAAILLVAMFFAVTIRCATIKTTVQIRQMCTAPSQETDALAYFSRKAPEVYRALKPDARYRQVWLRQMEHSGDIAPYLGTVVSWTGEATFLREIPIERLRGEPPAYREAWARGRKLTGRPLFIRLVINSYAHPGELGDGEVTIVCDQGDAAGIRDGDQITVLGEISAVDNVDLGCILLYGHALYRWHG